MFNLSWGNPAAHRVRVWYNTASKTIYEGMPVCYNYDTTTNWAGGSASNGAVTASSTLTDGTPETAAAKYLEVEEPNDGNLQFFAGVVAKGGWCGQTTSSTANVGIILDIYVPNGAIVPVRAGVGCTVARTILSVIASTQYLGHALSATEARPVAIVEETVDRSTAGLILAKLDPNMFLYQEQHGNALYSGVGATAAAAAQVVNRINVTSAQTTGNFTALWVQGGCSAGGAADGYGLALYVQADLSGAAVSHTSGTGLWMNITGGSQLGKVFAACEVGMYASDDADLDSIQIITPLVIQTQVNATSNAPPANSHYMIYLINNGSDNPDGLFNAKTASAIGAYASEGNAPALAEGDVMIPIRVSGNTYYLVGLVDTGV